MAFRSLRESDSKWYDWAESSFLLVVVLFVGAATGAYFGYKITGDLKGALTGVLVGIALGALLSVAQSYIIAGSLSNHGWGLTTVHSCQALPASCSGNEGTERSRSQYRPGAPGRVWMFLTLVGGVLVRQH